MSTMSAMRERPSGWASLGAKVTLAEPARSGVLQIVDDFEPLGYHPKGDSHAFQVVKSALDFGFTRPINVRELESKPSGSPNLKFLCSPDAPPEMTLQALDRFVTEDQLSLALDVYDHLNQGVRAQVQNTVTNFSFSSSGARIARDIYRIASSAWRSLPENATTEQLAERRRGQNISDNLARAWNIQASELSSPDIAVAGAARAQFQQNLIDRIASVSQAEPAQKARQMLTAAVEDYESNHNSVVISAGNVGTLLTDMLADNGGRELRTPSDFFDNILATPNATVVGALGPMTDGNSQVVGRASYSSPAQKVDLLAWGNSPDGLVGTSYSAPRVAMMMQDLHLQYPKATSAEVEEMVKRGWFSQAVFLTNGEGTRFEFVQ